MQIGGIFTIIIYACVNQDSFKPTFESHGYFQVPVFIKLMDVFKEFSKAFIHDFFNLVLIMLVTITNFHGVSLQEFIQFLLAGAVILSASSNQCANVVVTVDQ